MSLPFRKSLIHIAVKHKLDGFVVLDKIFHNFQLYVFDDPPLVYVEAELNKMIVARSILTGKYDSKTYVSFLKKADLLTLQDVWDHETFQDLLYDSDLRRCVDIMSMCGFKDLEIFNIVKAKIPGIDEAEIMAYLDCFADYTGMSFIEKKNFVYNYVNDPSHQRVYLKCLENRSLDYIRSVLNITLKSVDPMAYATRAAHIISAQTTQAIVDGDHKNIIDFLNLNLKVADSLQKLGAGNTSAADELQAALSGNHPYTPNKTYTIEELEALKMTNS